MKTFFGQKKTFFQYCTVQYAVRTSMDWIMPCWRGRGCIARQGLLLFHIDQMISHCTHYITRTTENNNTKSRYDYCPDITMWIRARKWLPLCAVIIKCFQSALYITHCSFASHHSLISWWWCCMKMKGCFWWHWWQTARARNEQDFLLVL